MGNKNKAKLVRALLCLSLMLLFGTAAAQDRYEVTATRLNVRKAASAESAVLGSLSKGDQVDVYSFKGGWAEIEFKNGRAYVAKKYIEKSSQPEEEAVYNEEESDVLPEISSSEPVQQETVAKRNDKDDTRIAGALLFAFGGKNSFKSTTLVFEFEAGNFISTTSAFYTFGLGLFFSDSRSKVYGYSYETSSWGFRFPVHVGYYVGFHRFHISARAGVYTNFLVNSKINKEHVDVSFGDRFSWSGGVRVAVGYRNGCLMAEYVFPFKSGSKGVWMFGFLMGI